MELSRERESSLPETLSDKPRSYYTQTKRHHRLYNTLGYGPQITFPLTKRTTTQALLREHVWTSDYERTATSIQAESFKRTSEADDEAERSAAMIR